MSSQNKNTKGTVGFGSTLRPELNVKESKRTKSIRATRKLAGIQVCESNLKPGWGEMGKQGSLSSPFFYSTDRGSISRKSLPPILTPGSDLIPDLLKEMRAGWEIVSGSLVSDRGLHWLRSMAIKSEVLDPDDLLPPTMSEMAATRDYFSLEGNSIKESVAKIAANSGASFIITGEGKSKWLRLGPSEGTRLVLDVKRATLKVWYRHSGDTPCTNSAGDPPPLKANFPQVSETLHSSSIQLGVDDINCKGAVAVPGGDSMTSGLGAGVNSNELIDSLGRVRTQEDLDEEITFTHRPAITQRLVARTHAPRLFLHSPGIKDLTDRCRDWEGPTYPPQGANEIFAGVICRLNVPESNIGQRHLSGLR